MYLIKSKGQKLVLRDRGRKNQPMLAVGPVKWVAFESLPKGHAVGEDVDLVIKDVVNPHDDFSDAELDLDPDPVAPVEQKIAKVLLPPWKSQGDVPELGTFVESFAGRMSPKDIARKLAPQGMKIDPIRETPVAMLERIHAAHAALAEHAQPASSVDIHADETPDLDKMHKPEIVEYAASLSLELDPSMKKDDMIDAVLERLAELDQV